MSHGMIVSVPGAKVGLNRCCASNTEVQRDHFEPGHFAVLTDKLLRPERRMDLDSLDQAFFNLFFGSGHFFARFEANEVHFPRAHAQGLAGDVHELFHGDVHFAGSQFGRGALGICCRLASFCCSRMAERATSMATLPPPMTTTCLPMEKR